ncbi:MAG: DUF4011 domain-containing protein [Kordiimonadaceae bacterium]|nr:DUF4011 domain-containing protein [Kordiimonadaceae bacterium]
MAEVTGAVTIATIGKYYGLHYISLANFFILSLMVKVRYFSCLEWGNTMNQVETDQEFGELVAKPVDAVDSLAVKTTPDYMTGDVTSGLERLRKRLLDLSKFNRLLNFRYYVRSTLRVIDELPDQLFEKLVNNGTFVFDPVPVPLKPNDKLKFWAAHPELLDTPDQLEKIKNPKDIPTPKVEAYAKWLDIRTDFELPKPNGELPSGRHQDTKIQTLLYPKDLEAVAARLTSLSRTAIEETGSNMLFLSFGFLEWTEDDNSDKTFFAPLLLLPAHLERQKKSRDGMFRYALSYSGEDLQANLSLQEKLKEFGLDFPDISGEGELPESYFKKVEKIIKSKPNWRIRRHVTLSILQFGRQLLYLDLDPENWPKKSNITNHELVSKFFLGGDSSGLDFAQEYEIDELEGDVADLPLITEADSSQHSAIVDMIKGRSLVIEGPPGTGKSQTITNMIGCALAEGKKVLFVAEKLAALEVVRRRLNQAGLGDFTLELHSNKTQKRTLLGDIETRLKKHGQYQKPFEIDTAMQELHKRRYALKRHASYMHDQMSQLDQSPFDLLHKAARYEREVLAACPDIEVLVRDRKEQFSIDQYMERLDALKTLLRSLGEIKSTSGSLSRSPWFGVNKEGMRARDRNQIIEAFEATVTKLETCEELIALLTDITKQEFDITTDTFEKCLGLDTALSTLPAAEIWRPVKFLSDQAHREVLVKFVNQIKDFDALVLSFNSRFSGADFPDSDQEISLKSALKLAANLAVPATPLHEIKEGIEFAEGVLQDIQTTEQEWINILSSVGHVQKLSFDNVLLANMAVKLCLEAPRDKLEYRSDIFDDDIDEKLNSLQERQRNLIARRDAINEHFSGFENTQKSILMSAANVLEDEGLVRILKPSWWNARGIYRDLCNKIEPHDDQSRPDWLRFIALYNEERALFEENRDYKQTFTHLFLGLETDSEGLISLRKWYRAVREHYGLGFNANAKFGTQLITLDSNVIKTIARLERQGLCDKCTDIEHAIDWIEKRFTTPLDKTADLSEHITLELKRMKAALSSLESLPLPLCDLQLTMQEYEEALNCGLKSRQIHSDIEASANVREILGDDFKSVSTEISSVESVLSFVTALDEADILSGIRLSIFDAASEEIINDIKSWHRSSHADLSSFLDATDALIGSYNLEPAIWFNMAGRNKDFHTFKTRTAFAVQNATLLGDWIAYVQNRRRVCDKGVADLVTLIEGDKLPLAQAENALAYLTYFPHADELAASDKYLSQINGDMLDELRSSYVRLDEKIQELNKQKIASILDMKSVPEGISGPRVRDKTELSLIHNEVNKRARHLPIRQLVRRSGRALQALKPCWMMGPLSVAQYLAAGEIEFDLVIMDEASQMRPEDSIGCIARAKQVIIVGDPKQLPPTSFFSKNVELEDDDDDLAGVEEAESILDAANSIFRPARRLRWHYRSQSEDLIAFSNKHFYNDDLVVFPSPAARSDNLGISYEYVPKASCKKGRNLVEAHLVAQRAIEFMESGTSNSLGVVALNSVQQQLIEDEFYKLLKSSPLAEAYMERRAQGAERFFIKNLENVQGDERDAIMISFTYGPDPESGKVMNRFGPINSGAGWRRLNVLYTRAKKRIIVISSMHAEDLKLSPDSQRGPKALKGFLAYAESGQLETGTHTGKEPDSDFEVAVASALKLRGYDCVAQLGVAGYFLDLAVKHPDEAAGFITGIECDGATYHSAKSVRDRDRLRQLVLERLGWNIERIWSTDWFEDSDRQIDKICTRIETIRERDKARRVRQEARKVVPIRTSTPEQSVLGIDEVGELGIAVDQSVQKTALNSGFISKEEAREKLIELRENTIHVENPSGDRSKGLLRNEMIDVLIRTLPGDNDEFLKFIPPYMRGDATDGSQLNKYGQHVFDVLADVDE